MFKSISSKALKSAIAASFVIASSSFLFTAPAQAYQCKSAYRVAVGKAPAKFMARAKAKKKWSSSTKADHGVPWSLWNIATSKSMNCKKQGGKWRCSAYAKPCLYVVT